MPMRIRASPAIVGANRGGVDSRPLVSMAFPELPLVSIVTPVLNGARFLPETLASVRGQDYPRLEHVVVDGGSTDGTLDLLRAAPGVVWVSGPDRGMYD